MKTIVCLGDSITNNETAPSYVDYWQKLAGKDYTIIGAGVNGETAGDGFRRLDDEVLRQTPYLVTVGFGHNEVHLEVSVLDYQRNIRRIVKAIQEAQAEVWLLTPTQIADQVVAIRYQPYLLVLQEVAAQTRSRFVDLWRVFDGYSLDDIFTYKFDYDGLTGRDYLHPNGLGMSIIAQRLMEELKDMRV